MIYKQWLSVIDERTTDNCIDADGQVQPIARPFDCLYGSFDSPPAHDLCRSQVSEFIDGMPLGPTGNNPGATGLQYATEEDNPPLTVDLPAQPTVIDLPRFVAVGSLVLAGLSPARRALVLSRVDDAQGDFARLPVWLQRAIVAAEVTAVEQQARHSRRRRSYALPVVAGANRRRGPR